MLFGTRARTRRRTSSGRARRRLASTRTVSIVTACRAGRPGTDQRERRWSNGPCRRRSSRVRRRGAARTSRSSSRKRIDLVERPNQYGFPSAPVRADYDVCATSIGRPARLLRMSAVVVAIVHEQQAGLMLPSWMPAAVTSSPRLASLAAMSSLVGGRMPARSSIAEPIARMARQAGEPDRCAM